jgi:hypothetical protein
MDSFALSGAGAFEIIISRKSFSPAMVRLQEGQFEFFSK